MSAFTCVLRYPICKVFLLPKRTEKILKYEIFTNVMRISLSKHLSQTTLSSSLEDEEFRKLDLLTKGRQNRKGRQRGGVKTEILPPRYKRMPFDQDWNSVWPTAQSFKPSTVPLPLLQGFVKTGAPPDKYANTELMKIPNFLHLTPPTIEKHCAALKKFCTPWPKQLKTDEICDKEFPVEIITNDYCHAGPSIRDSRARIVTLKVKLSVLPLDYHAKDKLLRLVADRYDPTNDVLSITVDRCPLRKQNYDYACYLLTALFYESWKVEPWESEKTEADMEKYFWNGSRSQKAIVSTFRWMQGTVPYEVSETDILAQKVAEHYGEAVSSIYNNGESSETLQHYKDAACQLLNITQEKMS
ncbi:28S ribosomal protein S35, mitochondrial-like [Limulus polyphemus]|uniref:28S ribosomal protein S35, mitochondrial-like n=1 Tax=Limulus polyphemus TaxID=6850 RepID=A0ABM1BN68_LIMPO|nr:28S ribosomal protein S35, mitochondrial-like [Limulus polyphemus]